MDFVKKQRLKKYLYKIKASQIERLFVFFDKKVKYMCGIFKKKLNLLKQNYYEEISTIVFFFYSLLVESLLFAKYYTQEASERKSFCFNNESGCFY
jgi:hypothetical protein